MGALFTALAVTTAIEDGWAGVPVLAVFAVWGFVSGVFKVRKARRLRLLVGYMTVLEDRSYCRVSELAAATSRTEKAVLADVRRFLQMGEMEGMYLSPDGARLFTGRTAYLAYLAQQEAAAGAAAGRTCRGGSRAHGERSVRELFAGAGRRKGVHPRQRGVR